MFRQPEQGMRQAGPQPIQVAAGNKSPFVIALGWEQVWVLINPALSLVLQLFFMASFLWPQRHHNLTGNKTRVRTVSGVELHLALQDTVQLCSSAERQPWLFPSCSLVVSKYWYKELTKFDVLKSWCWELGKSQTFVLQLMTWFSMDFSQSHFLLPFRPASTLSPFCPMHCPMMTYAASANFQLVNASFLLNAGGLGLCLSSEGPGPHL